MPRDYRIVRYISSEIPIVALALLAVPHQSLLWKWLLSQGELSVDFCSQSPGGNTSKHKAGEVCPHDLWKRICDFCFYLFPRALQSESLVLQPVFPLSTPSKMVYPASILFLFYHHKVGKAEWSKTGDGNFPGKGWRGTKRRKPAWTERHFTGDGHTALGIYPHL